MAAQRTWWQAGKLVAHLDYADSAHLPKRDHYSTLMNIFREHGGSDGVGIEYADTMIREAAPIRKNLKQASVASV